MKTQYMKSMLVGAAIAFAGAGVSVNATTFTDDVAASIDLGLNALNNNGAYNYPSSAGEATGLTVLALLEKRPPLNPLGEPLGYQNSSAADKARILRGIRTILDQHSGAGFYSYRDGMDLMALSAYILTGGPDQGAVEFTTATGGQPAVNLKTAFNQIFDRIAANQGSGAYAGYWCYNNGGCPDSSTTQLVVAGLAAARSVYSTADAAYLIYNDPIRLATLNSLTTASKLAYQTNGSNAGAVGGDLSQPGHPEKGHPYWPNVYSGYAPSLQQTASGTWIQLVGGGVDINEANVQSYLQWLANRYHYTDLGSTNAYNFWPISHYYYLWSSSKAYGFLEQSGVPANPGNVTPVSPAVGGAVEIGTLPPASVPAFAPRQLHRDPDLDNRTLVGQPAVAGYYAGERPRWYYDYAYTLMSQQDGSGNFNSPDGSWDYWSNQSYALLVLQRATGNACIDTDQDGVCDNVDNCPSVRNPSQASHSALNSVGDACQNRCDVNGDKAISSADVNSIKAMLNKPAAFVSDPRDANLDGKINILDAAICGKNVGKWHPIAGLNNPTWPELAP